MNPMIPNLYGIIYIRIKTSPLKMNKNITFRLPYFLFFPTELSPQGPIQWVCRIYHHIPKYSGKLPLQDQTHAHNSRPLGLSRTHKRTSLILEW